MRKLVALLCCLLAISSIATGQEIKKVAILQPVDRDANVAYSHKLMLRANLAKAIANTPGYEAYDRADLDAIMGEQDFQRTGMVSEDQIKRLGQMSGASFVLVSEAVKVDDSNMFITAKILNVETAKTEMTDNELMGTTAAEIQKGCTSLAQKLLGITPTEEPQDNASATKQEEAPAATRASRTADGYVDLGLESGTLWKATNEYCGLITFEQAVISFNNNLPSKEQWEELISSCTWVWMGNGYTVTGPNNENIFLPAEGIGFTFLKKVQVINANEVGAYWSTTPYDTSTLDKLVRKQTENMGGAVWSLNLTQAGQVMSFAARKLCLSVRLVK